MKLEDCREAYDYFTGTLSSISRQLGFAGLAVIWIFKTEQSGAYSVPPELILPGVLLVAGLAADFLHYALGSIIWGCYHRYKEINGTIETDEFLAPSPINWPGNFMFFCKSVLIAIAYYLLLVFLLGRLSSA